MEYLNISNKEAKSLLGFFFPAKVEVRQLRAWLWTPICFFNPLDHSSRLHLWTAGVSSQQSPWVAPQQALVEKGDLADLTLRRGLGKRDTFHCACLKFISGGFPLIWVGKFSQDVSWVGTVGFVSSRRSSPPPKCWTNWRHLSRIFGLWTLSRVLCGQGVRASKVACWTGTPDKFDASQEKMSEGVRINDIWRSL